MPLCECELGLKLTHTLWEMEIKTLLYLLRMPCFSLTQFDSKVFKQIYSP